VSVLMAATSNTQDAVANGESRSLTIFHTHTQESATITFRRNGQYDPAGLEQLNWILRDWRTDQTTNMDPRLFDTIWAVYREVGSREPINIVSAYRSPQTNEMLHHRSKAVSEHSQHMLGKAMDIRLPDIPAARLRATAMRLQDGGVGYYSSERFVHIDVGSVRAWPRMSKVELDRLFPDGKTVHLPARGGPLPGYAMAKAGILARGGVVAGEGGTATATASRRSLWAMLFGSGESDPNASASPATRQSAGLASEGAATTAGVHPPLPPARDAGGEQRVRLASLGTLPDFDGRRAEQASPVRQLFTTFKIERVGLFAPTPKAGAEMVLALAPSRLDLRFSAAANEELSPEKFTGPVIRSLPLIR
jgi:uncharacterized protein YcbK (DUF882 family)